MKNYSINCTGDACVGDHVRFEKAVFTGSFKRPRFSHYETIEAEIMKESYGAEKQQHTFTLQLADGKTMRIKGRNLYGNGCFRMEWPDENERKKILDEKHFRGEKARNARELRKTIFFKVPKEVQL